MATNRGIAIERKFLNQQAEEKYKKAKEKTLSDLNNPNRSYMGQLLEQESLLDAQRNLFLTTFDNSLSDLRRQVQMAQQTNRERQAITGIYDYAAQMRDNNLLAEDIDYQITNLLNSSAANALNFATQQEANKRSQLQASYQALIENEAVDLAERGVANEDQWKTAQRTLEGMLVGALSAVGADAIYTYGMKGIAKAFGGVKPSRKLFQEKFINVINQSKRDAKSNIQKILEGKKPNAWLTKADADSVLQEVKNVAQKAQDAYMDYDAALGKSSRWNRFAMRAENSSLFRSKPLFAPDYSKIDMVYVGRNTKELASNMAGVAKRQMDLATLMEEFGITTVEGANGVKQLKVGDALKLVDDIPEDLLEKGTRAGRRAAKKKATEAMRAGLKDKYGTSRLRLNAPWATWILAGIGAIIGGAIGGTKTKSYYLDQGDLEMLKSDSVWKSLADVGGWTTEDFAQSVTDYYKTYNRTMWKWPWEQ